MNKVTPTLIVLAAAILFSSDASGKDQEWHPLFNGRDLTGWKVPSHNIWWRVERGMLVAQSDPDKTGSTLWTDRVFDNFDLKFEFRFGKGNVDSGIYLRNSREQIQIGRSGSLKRDMTASPYISGRGYPVEAKCVKKLLVSDGWNTMQIKVVKGRYRVYLNDAEVLDYNSPTAAEKGPIGIQLHSGRDMSIYFRNITIADK